MRRIWKYEIPITDAPRTTFRMPAGAIVLPVADAPGIGDSVSIWADVEESAAPESRMFVIAGTGHPLAPGWIYRATAISRRADTGPLLTGWISSPLVWHVFEVVS